MDKQKKEQLILSALIIMLLVMAPKVLFKKRPAFVAGQAELQPGQEGGLYPVEAPAPTGPAPTPGAPAVQLEPAMPELTEAQSAVSKDPFDVPGDLYERLATRDGGEEEEYPQEEQNLPKVNLQGIVWGGIEPIAFIDDKIYKKGDTVSADAQILDIDKKGVWFFYDGRRVLMRPKNKP